MGNKPRYEIMSPRYEIMSGRDSKGYRYLYVVDANGSPVQDDDGNVERFYDLDDAEEYLAYLLEDEDK